MLKALIKTDVPEADTLLTVVSAKYKDIRATGNATIVYELTLTGAGSSNYTLGSYTSFERTNGGVISKRTLNVIQNGLANITKTYDGNTDVIQDLEALGAFTLGNNLTGEFAAVISYKKYYLDKNVGDKDVVIEFTGISGTYSSNYELTLPAPFTYVNAGRINPREISIQWLNAPVTKEYDGLQTLDGTNILKGTHYSFNNLPVGEDIGVTLTGSVDNGNVIESDVGATVTFGSLEGTDKDNYTLVGTKTYNFRATVTPKLLQIVIEDNAVVTKTYDGTPDKPIDFDMSKLNGIVTLGESVTFINSDTDMLGVFSTSNAGAATFTVFASSLTLSNANYRIDDIKISARISKLSLGSVTPGKHTIREGDDYNLADFPYVIPGIPAGGARVVTYSMLQDKSGSPAGIDIKSLKAGTYYVVADAYSFRINNPNYEFANISSTEGILIIQSATLATTEGDIIESVTGFPEGYTAKIIRTELSASSFKDYGDIYGSVGNRSSYTVSFYDEKGDLVESPNFGELTVRINLTKRQEGFKNNLGIITPGERLIENGKITIDGSTLTFKIDGNIKEFMVYSLEEESNIGWIIGGIIGGILLLVILFIIFVAVRKSKQDKVDKRKEIEEAAYRMITALGAPPVLALGSGMPMADSYAGRVPKKTGVTTKNGVTVGTNGKPVQEAKVVTDRKPQPRPQAKPVQGKPNPQQNRQQSPNVNRAQPAKPPTKPR